MRDICCIVDANGLGYTFSSQTMRIDAVDRSSHERSFDLIMLDVMMPGEDGFTVCRASASFTDVPIFMMTALNRPRISFAVWNWALTTTSRSHSISRNWKRVSTPCCAGSTHRSTGVSFDVAEFGDLTVCTTIHRQCIGGGAISN